MSRGTPLVIAEFETTLVLPGADGTLAPEEATRLRPGAYDYAAACAARGRFAVVSRAPRPVLQLLLERTGLDEWCTFAWSRDDRAADPAQAIAEAVTRHRAIAGREAPVQVLAASAPWLAAAHAAGVSARAVPRRPDDLAPEVKCEGPWDNFLGRTPDP